MKDKQEYLDAKAKYEMDKRKKEGKPAVDAVKEPDLPNPNRPHILGYRSLERTRTITSGQAEQLLQELLQVYDQPGFQKKVHADAKAVMYEYQPFIRRLKKTAFTVQEPVLQKWGFDPSEEGLNEMMLCLSDQTLRNEKLRKLAEECTMMLYGGEDGMWGMDKM